MGSAQLLSSQGKIQEDEPAKLATDADDKLRKNIEKSVSNINDAELDGLLSLLNTGRI